MIRVIVNGALGKMGQEVVRAVSRAEDMVLVGAVDLNGAGKELLGTDLQVGIDLAETIKQTGAEVVVDFTNPEHVMNNIHIILANGARAVVGTTGITPQNLQEIETWCQTYRSACLVAPNFALGAILMMEFARKAARYFPDVEIIELHHDQKLDAPSGTAIKTAEIILAERGEKNQGHPGEKEVIPASRGGNFAGMRIHSVRLPGYVAHQEVIFGGLGQTLTIRHDSISRESFMPGVLLGIRQIFHSQGLVYGLDNFLEL